MSEKAEALSLLRVGAWWTFCCHLDLYRVEAEDIDDVREYLRGDIDGDEPVGCHVWTTREEALDEIAGWWGADQATMREIDAMRADPALCGSVAIAARLRGD